MATPTVPPDDLALRLCRIERRNRILSGACAILATCGLAAFLLGADACRNTPAKTPKTLEAESFVLKDSSGRVRATLSVLDGGGAAVVFWDAKQHLRLICGVNAAGAPSVQLNDAKETGRAVYGLDEVDSPGLDLSDRGGQRRVRLQVADRQGEQPAVLSFADDNGHSRVAVMYSSKISGLFLSDGTEATRGAFAAAEQGVVLSMIKDANDKTLWSVP